jgi:hypothetical protein
MKVLQRVLIAVVVLVVSVPVVAVLGFSLWWHHVTTGPDVRKESQSAKARQQRTATVAILDETVTAFVSTAPSGTRLATSVNDSCGSDTGFLGERPQMFCRRDVVVYLAFDGDQAGIQRTWTSGLAAHHWKRSERPPTGVQQYFYEFADSPRVQLQWGTRPKEPEHPRIAFTDEITVEQQPVDVAEVYRDGYARHRYVVELAAGSQYYPEAPKAPRSPAPAPGSPGHGCFNGHDCPGG